MRAATDDIYGGLCPTVRFCAIHKNGDTHLTWYKKPSYNTYIARSPEMPAGCVATTYQATGQTVANEAGEVAELYELVKIEARHT